MRKRTVIPSPVGALGLAVEHGALVGIRFLGVADPRRGDLENEPVLRAAVLQLDEYFAGRRFSFDLPLAPAGTPFQRAVWDAVRTIPYGRTLSYRAIAEEIGRPAAVRAVGAANGANPIPIVMPCHRVIGSDGTLTGYGGGLENKRLLLELESERSKPPARTGGSSTASH